MKSSQYLLRTSKEYSVYICQQRAIPHVIDGLKHVQRLALWLLRNRAEKIKTVALGGLLAYERLYVHGDASANEAIGFMAAPFKNNIPLIEGLGHFGNKIAPSAVGAPRYTEVRRARAAEALLYKDLDIIPLEDNYDGSNVQPKHFLPLIPMVLLNGVEGIAIGWSTKILPRDIRALIEATRAALLGKPIKLLPPSYANYDIAVEDLGENRWQFSGRATVTDPGTVHVTELPPGISIEAFRKRLIAMETAGKIQDYIDKSTENIDIVIKMKRRAASLEVDAKPLKYPDTPITDWSEKELLDFFKLREKVTERIVVVAWNGTSIITYESAEQLVSDFAQWRLRWYSKRYEHYTKRDQRELTYWLALRVLFESDFMKRLGGFANRSELQEAVVQTLASNGQVLDHYQLDRVVSLPTYRWTKEFEQDVNTKIVELEQALLEYAILLRSPDRLRDVFVRELDDLRSVKF